MGDAIPLLARHFMERAAKANRKAGREIAAEAQALLMEYSWPGNVRELQNIMERLVILGSEGPVMASELPECVHRKQPAPLSHKQLLLEMHHRALSNVLDVAKGNARKAAALAGIHYKSFHRAAKRANVAHKIIRPPIIPNLCNQSQSPPCPNLRNRAPIRVIRV